MVKVAVMGYGTVGSGVVEVIEKNKDMIQKKAGQEIEVAYILDLREFPGDPYEAKLVHDVNVIMEDPRSRSYVRPWEAPARHINSPRLHWKRAR
ncbi:MAG: hypothetical protein J6Q02_08550, partial [Lachnospiraceae bacterium]|nr:hypothetical protein [Lachnospiraceae bacterium]